MKKYMPATGITRILGVLFVLVVGSCGNPYTSRFTQSKPTLHDLIGTWRVDTEQSFVPFNFDSGIQNAALVLHADGTLEALNLPGKIFHEAGGISDVSGQGTWNIQKEQDWWVVRLNWQERSDIPTGLGESIHVRNQSPEYLLHYTVGDPDEGYAVVFLREKKRGHS